MRQTTSIFYQTIYLSEELLQQFNTSITMTTNNQISLSITFYPETYMCISTFIMLVMILVKLLILPRENCHVCLYYMTWPNHSC